MPMTLRRQGLELIGHHWKLDDRTTVVPVGARRHMLDRLYYRHTNFLSMYINARRLIFLPEIKAQLSQLYNKCDLCQVNRKAKEQAALMTNLNLTSIGPMDSLNIDFDQFGSSNIVEL